MCAECEGRPRCGQHTFPRQTPLCLEGDDAQWVFALIEGCAREVRATIDGRVQPVRLIRPGELAGVEALTAKTYHATVESLGRVIACRVPAAEVRGFMEEHPEHARGFLGELMSELQSMRESVLWIGAYSAEERVLALLKMLAGPAAGSIFVELPLNRLEMAEFLGLAHATVSRLVQRFAREGLIEVRGRWIRITDRGSVFGLI